MKVLQMRSACDGVLYHTKQEARIYSENGVQRERIEKARAALRSVIGERTNCTIIELGCGTLDISGTVSETHRVIGMECNPAAVEVAHERWPKATICASLEPQECDVLVLCEFLEHIPDPAALVGAWLPLAKACIISHPLDGDLTGDLSAGEHQWSFGEADFRNWFVFGGHTLEHHEVFRMGGYQIIIGRGTRE